MDVVEAPAGQTYTTILQNNQEIVVKSWNSFYPDGLYHMTREGQVLELCQANWQQREIGSEMRDYVCDDFKNSTGGSQMHWGTNWVRAAGAQCGLGMPGAYGWNVC
jgi:hypothetical protein